MNLEVFGLVLINLVGILPCYADHSELYKQVFEQTEPKLERNKVIEMLEKLGEEYKHDPYESYKIAKVLRDSKVTEFNCQRNRKSIVEDLDDSSGRAYQLLKDSEYLQAKLCLQVWETSLLASIANLDEEAKDSVSSMIKSMFDANGNRAISGYSDLEMPYESAQKGVMMFMEKKTGKSFTKKKTKQGEFDKEFYKLVYAPCRKIIENLSPVASRYLDLSKTDLVNDQMDSIALEWTRNSQICKYLCAYGYTSNKKYSFSEDTFRNLAFK